MYQPVERYRAIMALLFVTYYCFRQPPYTCNLKSFLLIFSLFIYKLITPPFFLNTETIFSPMYLINKAGFLLLVQNFHLLLGKKVRDIETEEKLEELYDKIRDLEKQNLQYKEKVFAYTI